MSTANTTFVLLYALRTAFTIAFAEDVTPNKLSPTTTPGSDPDARTKTALAFVLKFVPA